MNTRPQPWTECREQRQDNADAAANDAAIGPAIYSGALPYPANEPDADDYYAWSNVEHYPW